MTSQYKRIIGNLLISNGQLCRTKEFIPDYYYTLEYIDTKNFDELLIINVGNNSNIFEDNFNTTIAKIMKKVELPLILGGNINNEKSILRSFEIGADRVLLGKSSLRDDIKYEKVLSKYGMQAFIGSIVYDSRKIHTSSEKESIKALITQFTSLGVSEIMLTAIDRDGSLKGLDLTGVEFAKKLTNSPLILSGGLGNWKHIEDALSLDSVVGVSTSNIHHLSSSAIDSAREFLIKKKVPIRYNHHKL
jgi:cyclase